MSNLIPELRVDKNGRTVTKHVRAIAKGSDTKNIPSPSLGITPGRAERKNRIRSVLSGISVLTGDARERMEERLWNMDPAMFDRLEKLAKGNEETEQWRETHRFLVRSIINDPSDENLSLYLNAIDAFDDDYQEWADVRTLLSLRKIPKFAPYAEDFRQAPDELIEAAHRLGDFRNEMGGFVRLYSNTKASTRLKSRELESIIINEPEKATRLVDWHPAHVGADLTALDSALALRVINNPHEREPIAEMLGNGATDPKLINLALDRPESRQQIFDLASNGINQIESIVEVLDGNIKPSFASGIL